MARRRFRTLKPEFFKDEKIVRLGRDARLTAIGLMTLADDRGRLRDRPLSILGDLYEDDDLSEKKVRKWLDEIAKTEWFLRYEVEKRSFIWIKNFLRHQVVNKPTESEFPPHPADPWAAIPIKEAFKAAKLPDDYGSSPVVSSGDLGEYSVPTPVVLPPYARTRASSPLSSSKESSLGKDEVDAQARDGSAVVRELFEYWQEKCKHPLAKLSDDRRGKIVARLKEGRTPDEVRQAIDGAARAPFVNDKGKSYDDIELICRAGAKFEDFHSRGAISRPVSLADQHAEAKRKRDEEEAKTEELVENQRGREA